MAFQLPTLTAACGFHINTRIRLHDHEKATRGQFAHMNCAPGR